MQHVDPKLQGLWTQFLAVFGGLSLCKAITWPEFRQEFQGFYAPPLRPRSTGFSVRRMLDVCEELGVTSMDHLTPALVTQFCQRTLAKDGKPLTLRTVAGQLAYLRVACKYAADRRYIESDPTLAQAVWIPSRALDDPIRSHLSIAEAAAVIRQADFEALGGAWKPSRLQYLVYLLGYLGLRAGEAKALKCDDVDMAEGLVCIKKNRRRNLKTRESAAFLPMPPPLQHLTQTWKPRCGGAWMVPACDVSKPWQFGGPGSRALDQIRDLGLRAGVAGVNLRIWRPTVATLLEGAGATDEQIQRILRHTSPLTAAQHYRKRDVPAMRNHVGKIVYDTPPELTIHRGVL